MPGLTRSRSVLPKESVRLSRKVDDMTTAYFFDRLPVRPVPPSLISFTGFLNLLATANGQSLKVSMQYALFGVNKSARTFTDLPQAWYGDLPTASGFSEAALQAMTFYHLLAKFGYSTYAGPAGRFLLRSVSDETLPYCPTFLVRYGC